MQCQFFEGAVGVQQTLWGNVSEHRCAHHRHKTTTMHGCITCKDYLCRKPTIQLTKPGNTPDTEAQKACLRPEKPPKECPHPSGVIVDRYGRDAGAADLYYGASCFLVLGGPSVKAMDLSLLSRRGVLIMSVNNCPAVLPAGIRPHIWLHTDPCEKFHDSIWRDPSVLKFTPIREWSLGRGGKRSLCHRNDSGQIEHTPGACARDMPAIFGFARNTEFNPRTYLWEASINRGNSTEYANGEKGHTPNGWPHTINTMFAAIRLAFYLGIRTLYMIGCDFRMNDAQPYAFDQGKSSGGVRANNSAFAKMCVMFDALLPEFDNVGFRVVNCTPNSSLWSFPYVPFQEAISVATENFQEELDTNGWYDKSEQSASCKQA